MRKKSEGKMSTWSQKVGFKDVDEKNVVEFLDLHQEYLRLKDLL